MTSFYTPHFTFPIILFRGVADVPLLPVNVNMADGDQGSAPNQRAIFVQGGRIHTRISVIIAWKEIQEDTLSNNRLVPFLSYDMCQSNTSI